MGMGLGTWFAKQVLAMSPSHRETVMNKDQVKGATKDVAGKAQRKVGEAIGSTSQQAKGAVKQIEGKAQKAVGDVRESMKGSQRGS